MPELARYSPAPRNAVGSVPRTWQEEAAARKRCSVVPVRSRAGQPSNRDLIAFQLAQAIGPASTCPTSPRKDSVSCGRNSCSSARSPWRRFYIWDRAVRRLRFTSGRGRGRAARVQALWRHRQRGLVARRPVLSPRRRRTGGAVAEARRHDQSVKGGAAAAPADRPRRRRHLAPSLSLSGAIRAEGA